MISSEWLNAAWWNLAIRCIVQKSGLSLNLGPKVKRSRSRTKKKQQNAAFCLGVVFWFVVLVRHFFPEQSWGHSPLRRWENQRMLSSLIDWLWKHIVIVYDAFDRVFFAWSQFWPLWADIVAVNQSLCYWMKSHLRQTSSIWMRFSRPLVCSSACPARQSMSPGWTSFPMCSVKTLKVNVCHWITYWHVSVVLDACRNECCSVYTVVSLMWISCPTNLNFVMNSIFCVVTTTRCWCVVDVLQRRTNQFGCRRKKLTWVIYLSVPSV